MPKGSNVVRVLTTGVAAALLLAACGKEQGGAPPPAEVSVVTLKPRPVAITDQLPGRTTAFRVAEVRPQVTGIVQKRLFSEGTEVKAGAQLFQIGAAGGVIRVVEIRDARQVRKYILEELQAFRRQIGA